MVLEIGDAGMSESRVPYTVKLPPMTEKELERDVDNYLAVALPPDSLVFAFGRAGGRPKCPNCGTWVGRLAGGVPPGTPDRLIMVPGGIRDIWVELKSGRNQPTELQLRCRDALRLAGRASYICWSVKQVAEVLRAEGVELRCKI